MQNVLELLQPEILSHDQDLLPVQVRPEDLGALADDEHAVVGVEQAKEVVRVRDDVPARVRLGRDRVDELAGVQPVRVRQALDVARDGL
jgi:hypothetical protein